MQLIIYFLGMIMFLNVSCTQQQKNTDKKVVALPNQLHVEQKIKIAVEGMTCIACQSTVKKTIQSLEGVKDATISLENKIAFITYYPDIISPEQIQKAVNDKGYTVGKPQEIKQ